jgi:hypothetical protein
MHCYSRQHILEPSEWLDRIPLAGRDEAHQYSGRSAAGVTPKKCPVISTDRDVPVCPLRSAIIDLQIAIFQEARQCIPLIQRVAHRLSGRALRQNLISNL